MASGENLQAELSEGSEGKGELYRNGIEIFK